MAAREVDWKFQVDGSLNSSRSYKKVKLNISVLINTLCIMTFETPGLYIEINISSNFHLIGDISRIYRFHLSHIENKEF